MVAIQRSTSEVVDTPSTWLGSLGWSVVLIVEDTAGMPPAVGVDYGLRVKDAGQFTGGLT